MAKSCTKDNEESIAISYGKITIKSFVLVVSILLLMLLKDKLLQKNGSIFLIALFVVFATLIFSLLGITDSYVYNNLIVGIGIAIGMHIMKF